MGDPGPRAPRRYSDQEVRHILEAATDGEAGTALVPTGDGLSLSEIEAAAHEAGIDPAAVRAAALSRLPAPSPSVGSRLVGGPARRHHTLFVPGRLPADRHHEVTAALETVLEREMTMEQEDGYVAWEEDHRQGWTRISARDVEGGVEVGVEADRRGWVTLVGLGSVAATVALVPLLAAFVPAVLGAPFLLAGVAAMTAVGGTRLVWAPSARRLHRNLERAVAAVVARIEPPMSGPDPERALTEPSGT